MPLAAPTAAGRSDRGRRFPGRWHEIVLIDPLEWLSAFTRQDNEPIDG